MEKPRLLPFLQPIKTETFLSTIFIFDATLGFVAFPLPLFAIFSIILHIKKHESRMKYNEFYTYLR